MPDPITLFRGAASAGALYAVGHEDGLRADQQPDATPVWRFDRAARAWTVVLPDARRVNALAATDDSVFALARDGRIWSTNAEVPDVPSAGNNLYGLSVDADGAAASVGANNAFHVRMGSEDWTSIEVGPTAGNSLDRLRAVGTPGDYESIEAYMEALRAATEGLRNLYCVVGTPPGDVLAGTDGGILLRWDGTTLSEVATGTSSNIVRIAPAGGG